MSELLSTLPRPAALVCGSGGLNAAAQAGLLTALGDWRPDLVVGASGGALTAVAMWGVDDPAAEAARAWDALSASNVVQVGWSRIASAVAGREANRTAKQWRTLFDSLFEDRELDSGGRQILVATDVSIGRPRLITSGSAVQALLAATAFPLVASPVEDAGSILIDGSFVAALPVQQARQAGARSIVALDTGRADPHAPPRESARWYDVVLVAIRHQVAANAAHDVADVAAEVPVVVLAAPDPFRVVGADIHHAIARGERAGHEQMAELERRWASITQPGVYTAAAEVSRDRRLTGLVR